MQSVGFPRLALHIARKDWAESKRIILGLTTALMVPSLITRMGPDSSRELATGLLAGLLTGTGFGYAQYCFINERQRGTLELLLSLPIDGKQLVLAKYVSLYSMVVFTVNIPALIVPDLTLIYVVNAASLFLATVFMAATVVSDKPWAPQLPLYVLAIFILPFQQLLTRYFPQGLVLFDVMTSNPVLLSTVALGLTPLVVMASASIFQRGKGLT